jgi:hypothetical protein
MRVAILFIDGVGVGAKDPTSNPLAAENFLLSWFDDGTGAELPGGGARHLVDPTFGVRGRPQSASNQTAIYTALDAPALVGAHVLGFPNAALKALLAQHSVMARLAKAGREVAFANAFPGAFLSLLGLPHDEEAGPQPEFPARLRRRAQGSASVWAMHAAGVRFRTFTDAREGHALTHDLDGHAAASRGFAVPRRTPAEAAAVFWGLAREVTLFEHFLADEAGHLQDHGAARQALGTFDAFLRALVATRPADCCVLVCSDHGNVEDLRTRNHTLNLVQVLTFGAPSTHAPLKTVADVGRLVLQLASHQEG